MSHHIVGKQDRFGIQFCPVHCKEYYMVSQAILQMYAVPPKSNYEIK